MTLSCLFIFVKHKVKFLLSGHQFEQINQEPPSFARCVHYLVYQTNSTMVVVHGVESVPGVESFLVIIFFPSFFFFYTFHFFFYSLFIFPLTCYPFLLFPFYPFLSLLLLTFSFPLSFSFKFCPSFSFLFYILFFSPLFFYPFLSCFFYPFPLSFFLLSFFFYSFLFLYPVLSPSFFTIPFHFVFLSFSFLIVLLFFCPQIKGRFLGFEASLVDLKNKKLNKKRAQ